MWGTVVSSLCRSLNRLLTKSVLTLLTCSPSSGDHCQSDKALEVPLHRPTKRDLQSTWFGCLLCNLLS